MFGLFALAHLVRAFAEGVLAHKAQPDSDLCVPFRVDPNEATLAELAALPGVGPSRAAAILLHRVRNGPFRTLDDLDLGDGFGEAVVAQLRPFLMDPRLAAVPASPRIR